jgi:ankyrin repeat protein
MAARRGDSKQLKDLLQLEEDGEDIRVDVDTRVPDAAAGQQQQQRLQPAAAPLPIHADGGGVTMEGDSLLHVVAACGDGDEFIKCAEMIVRDKERKGGTGAKRQVLQARNGKGDTPLHCAAGAGHAEMVSCLVALAADDTKALVRTQNQCGETALHQAIRAANNSKQACIDRLMSVDPALACIPRDDDDAEEEGASSPLYLAISLGELEIASQLFERTGGNLSYSGPHGRNVLHAAVSRGQGDVTLMLLLTNSLAFYMPFDQFVNK